MNTTHVIHTPGPSCTCQVRHHRHDTGIGIMEETDIDMCPFHTAAPAMYEALQATLAYFLRSKQSHAPEVRVIRAALAQAEGR